MNTTATTGPTAADARGNDARTRSRAESVHQRDFGYLAKRPADPFLDAPITFCDRCLITLGAVITFAPILLFFLDRYIKGAAVWTP